MQNDPIEILGREQSRVDPNLPDAGLLPLGGVRSVQIFRASHDVPELTDGRGWTYHHHVDMACWRGRLYVAWNSCEKDEDVWPSRELFSTSIDGAEWTPPQEMFPQGVSTPLRMYFFHAPNGRMLVVAGLRLGTENTDEDLKGGLVVREIFPDHQLGPVFTLLRPGQRYSDAPDLGAARSGASEYLCPGVGHIPAMFDQCSDPVFVEACRQLLSDTLFLEQQDYGRLLGPRRMKWHEASNWPNGIMPGNGRWIFGKAQSFFRRPDGAIASFSKMGWVTVSHDDGKTWSAPVQPETLVTGGAKVWAQRTSDGRYALVYNPHKKNRFPLALVSGDDGVHFCDMRIIQGELPSQRYEGRARSIGPQYVRGISSWADDGSRAGESAMWLVYSMSKEDIWVSRVPLPIGSHDDEWITYQPKWSSIRTSDDSLRLETRDPYDYPIATKLLAPSRNVTVSFDLNCSAPLEIEAGETRVALDHTTQRFEQTLTQAASPLRKITFRLGRYRGIGGSKPVPPGTDRPTDPILCEIRNLKIICSS